MTGPGSQAGCVQGGRAGHRPTPQGALFPEALGPWEAPPQARAGCPAQAHGALVSLQGPLLRPRPPRTGSEGRSPPVAFCQVWTRPSSAHSTIFEIAPFSHGPAFAVLNLSSQRNSEETKRYFEKSLTGRSLYSHPRHVFLH